MTRLTDAYIYLAKVQSIIQGYSKQSFDICASFERTPVYVYRNMQTLQPTNLQTRLTTLPSHWQPSRILTLNSSHTLKIAKIQGPFIWHSHPDTDEVFQVLSGGPLRLELCTHASSPQQAEAEGADQVVEMRVGDVFLVPKGVQHRPVAEGETGILMIERVGTVNTGDRKGHERTAVLEGEEV